MDFSEVASLDEFHGFNAGHNRHINGPTYHLEIFWQFTMNIYEPDLFVYDIDCILTRWFQRHHGCMRIPLVRWHHRFRIHAPDIQQ